MASSRGNGNAATDYAAQAINGFEVALDIAPGDRAYQNFIVEAALFHASELRVLREFEQALIPLDRADLLIVELNGRYPSVRRYVELHIDALRERAILEGSRENELEAVALARQVIDLRRELLETYPAERKARYEFAGSVATFANRLIMTTSLGEQRFKDAELYAREAMTIPGDSSTESLEHQQMMRFCQLQLSLALAGQNRIKEAQNILSELEAQTPPQPMDLRYYADGWNELLLAVLRSDAPETQVEEITDRTFLALSRAIDAGYRNVAELEHTEALDPLRDDPRFQELLSKANEQ